jgi:hypothetical protein
MAGFFFNLSKKAQIPAYKPLQLSTQIPEFRFCNYYPFGEMVMRPL